jgi:NADH:ubiquinone oxidoreductase subunit
VNIDDIIEANTQAGQHWFSQGALGFFHSRIGQTVYGAYKDGKPLGQYFITSEKEDDDAPRRYTVRRYSPEDHTISNASWFMEYKTSQGAAKRAIRERDAEQARALDAANSREES